VRPHKPWTHATLREHRERIRPLLTPEALAALPKREAEVMRLYYHGELVDKEVASFVGCSQPYVRHLRLKCLVLLLEARVRELEKKSG
jgi:DNA-directed RNA polymerase specialized sigma subunit